MPLVALLTFFVLGLSRWRCQSDEVKVFIVTVFITCLLLFVYEDLPHEIQADLAKRYV